jgi:hypothetical protein
VGLLVVAKIAIRHMVVDPARVYSTLPTRVNCLVNFLSGKVNSCAVSLRTGLAGEKTYSGKC